MCEGCKHEGIEASAQASPPNPDPARRGGLCGGGACASPALAAKLGTLLCPSISWDFLSWPPSRQPSPGARSTPSDKRMRRILARNKLKCKMFGTAYGINCGSATPAALPRAAHCHGAPPGAAQSGEHRKVHSAQWIEVANCKNCDMVR